MSKNITELDKNLKVETTVGDKEVVFFDIRQEPFKIYGLYNPKEEKQFVRLPEKIADATSEGVSQLCRNTSGGRVRFKTNSKYIAVKAEMNSICAMPHMTLCGSSGMDLYVKKNNEYIYNNSFLIEWGNAAAINSEKKGGYTNITEFADEELRDITINFPLYNELVNLYIGLSPDAVLSEGDSYRDIAPVVFYGSSITQGGCASRPGNNYSAILSRKYDVDFINLGFSGNAKGEQAIADYIADLDMSVFVYDYDHNAPSCEHLSATHEPMYKTIRKKHPDIPVIFMSRPKVNLDSDEKQRREIIHKTYTNAKANGENVYFIDGEEIFKFFGGDSGSVDGCHPNDLGFMCMAHAVDQIFKRIF